MDRPTLSLVNAIRSAKCAASLSLESFNIFSIVLDNVSMWFSFLCSFSVAYTHIVTHKCTNVGVCASSVEYYKIDKPNLS